ncbi:protein of unknown function [Paenibacillus alvei]|uniref:Uncharacterized protein n=1 Tax=Paenibacillus alvei TaxID=44250 RepID=A0A383RF37_PAEAL|nr:protein of unknown function [Paenibacillus alvei]
MNSTFDFISMPPASLYYFHLYAPGHTVIRGELKVGRLKEVLSELKELLEGLSNTLQ